MKEIDLPERTKCAWAFVLPNHQNFIEAYCLPAKAFDKPCRLELPYREPMDHKLHITGSDIVKLCAFEEENDLEKCQFEWDLFEDCRVVWDYWARQATMEFINTINP